MGAERLDQVESEVKHHVDPVVSASEIADEIDVSRRTALNDLRLLERDGVIDSKEIGARAVAWFHVDRVTPAPPRDPSDHPDQHELDEIDIDYRNTTLHSGGFVDDSDDLDPDVDALVDELELPGSGDTLEDRRDAVRACWRYLRDNETATKSDFTDDVYPDHTARFGSSGGWWNAIGKQGLTTLAERHDSIDAPAEGEHQWQSQSY